VQAGSLRELSDPAVAEVTVDLHRAADVVGACAAAGLERVAACGYAQSEGFVTAAAWLRVKTRMSQRDAAAKVRTAQRLAERYPATAGAWTGGRITAEHADVLASGLDRVCLRLAGKIRRDAADTGMPLTPVEVAERVAVARAGFERDFLQVAVRYPPDVLRTGIDRALCTADPDGATRAAMDAFNDQSLVIRDVGDMAVTTLHSTREVAAALRTVLDHFRDARFRAGAGSPDIDASAADGAGTDADTAQTDTAAEPDIDPVTGKEREVRQSHLDAVAFGDWVTATLDGGVGSGRQTERPHVELVVTLAELQGLRGGGTLTATAEPVPAATAVRVACDADLTLVTTTGVHYDRHTGDVLNPLLGKLINAPLEIAGYGRTERIVPADLRRALAHRDGGCAFPGCHRPPRHTQAHHIRHWLHGGITDLANLVLLCSRHHHYVHEGGWTITPRKGRSPTMPGCWQFTPPDRPSRR
jgi:hypothetical protein